MAIAAAQISTAHPGWHRPPPHHYPPHHCNAWIPATIFSSAFAISALANATRHETVYVQQQPSTTVIYQNTPATTTTVVAPQQPTVKREEIRPDGTRVLYYE